MRESESDNFQKENNLIEETDDTKTEENIINTSEKKDEDVVNWRQECINGNLMPGVLLVEQNKISVNEVVNPENGNTLLHYACNFGFYNVIRTLIEKFNADINVKNKLGYTPMFLIVSNTDTNIFNFQYCVKTEKIDYSLYDINGLNFLVHSIITNFHYAFLYFCYLNLTHESKNDKYANPLIYFAITNNNKFALIYLLFNKNSNINDTYYNNTSFLSDILITNKNNTITKFLVKYFNEEISLKSIHTCKKSILNFPFYNVYNYELLNTLYFYKTKNYWSFILALFKKYKPRFNRCSNQRLLEDNLVNNDIGYRYKMINFKYMFYDLILPKISNGIKVLLFLLYLCLFYFGTNQQFSFILIINNESNMSYFYLGHKVLSILLLFIWFIVMFNSSTKLMVIEDQNENNTTQIEKEIAQILKGDNILNLPYIEEICPACGKKKKLEETHCFRCKTCFKYKYFHSNLFNICITKGNIKRYLVYLILKINFYFICLYNLLDKNPTNKTILAFLLIFRYKTSISNIFLEFIVGFFLIKEIGHFIALIICFTVKTPYEYIYKCHKKVYQPTLKEKGNKKIIVQSPEINENISFIQGIKNIIRNIC